MATMYQATRYGLTLQLRELRGHRDRAHSFGEDTRALDTEIARLERQMKALTLAV